jgi:hypothetical protein
MRKLIFCLIIVFYYWGRLFSQPGMPSYNPVMNPPYFGPTYYQEKNYYKGYILTKTDTIKCIVEEYNQEFGDAYVLYKLNPDDKKTKEIAYRDIVEVFDNKYYYDIVNINDRLLLLRRLCEGPIILYEWEKIIDTSFGQKNKTKYYLKRSDKTIMITKSSFKEDLKTMLIQNQEICNEIESMDYDDVCINIISLVNKYNNWSKNQ